ncbi:MAG: ferredoxin, partial [Staphylothermus sp.]|nr:ferredoxin [Staphylothermus sp.]
MIEEKDIIRDTVITIAKLMSSSAITAPKARGMNNIQVRILDNKDELYKLAEEMEKLAPKYGSFFARDANNVRSSDAVV